MLSVLTVVLLLIIFVVLLVLFAAIDIVFGVKGSPAFFEHSVTVRWLFFSKKVSPSDEEGDENEGEESYGIIEDTEVSREKDSEKDAENFVTEKVTGYFEEGKKEKVKAEKRKKEKGKKKKKSVDMSYSEMFQAFRQLKSPVIRLLKGLVYAVKVPYASVTVVYGFPDPAYTGMACGYSHAAMSYLSCHFKNLNMVLEPDFVDSRFDLDMSGKVRIRIFRFIPVILLFILNRNVLHFTWQFIIKKKSKKPSVNF